MVPVAILLLAVYLIGEENDLFRPRCRLLFTVPKGTGFSRGMPVKLSGFRIGRLADMGLNDEARVDIMIDIDRTFMKWVREDSTVRLVKEGIVGESVLEVSVGSMEKEMLKDGGRIRYEHVRTLEELATDVTEKVTPVLLEVRDIISYVNDPQGDVKRLLRNLATLTERLDRTLTGLDAVLADLDDRSGAVAVDLRQTIRSADRVLTEAESALLTINRSLPPILSSSERTLASLERVADRVGRSSEAILPRIPRVIDSTESTLESSRELIDGTKRIWPLSRTIPPPPSPFLPVQSNERP